MVNDDPVQLLILAEHVRKAGLEPRPFSGAEAALVAMSIAATPALIVTDLHMPGLDGWRFCRLLRSPQYAALNQVPILVVSATYSGAEATRIATDLGAEAFLSSPVDGARFSEQVRAIMQGERVRNPLRILIVDVSAPFCDSLKQAFTAHGYEVQTALTSQAAVKAFGEAAYDVAVLNDHLPDGRGHLLLETFHAERPDCVCLMITSDLGTELALGWMKQGAAACLHKPFHPDYLIELCARARRERMLLRVQDLVELRTRELRQSESNYSALLEATGTGFLVLDRNGCVVDANSEYVRLSGHRERCEIIGRSVGEWTSEHEKQKSAAALAKCIQDGSIQSLLLDYVDGAGRITPVEISATFKGVGDAARIIAFCRDITERNRTMNALRESEERYRSILQASPDDITITDRNGCIVMVSPVAFTLFGGARTEEFMGRPVTDFIVPEDRARALAKIALKRQGINTGPEEYRGLRRDGGTFDIEVNSEFIRDAAGAPTGMVVIVRDITERKRHETEMVAMLEKQREISEMKSRFISTTSHEFRTPIAAAMMAGELLANHFDHFAPAKRMELLARVNSSLRRMTGMLDEVLLLNRLEQNRIEVKLAPVDFRLFLADLVEEVRLGDRDEHRFNLDMFGDASRFLADSDLLHHILSNLLSNAVRYSPNGTLIAVRLEADATQVQVTIVDQGIGIPLCDQERIFEPFERGSNVGQIKGTGLGLNIVKRMTERLAGRISFESVAGGGTRFILIFPHAAMPAAAEDLPALRPQANSHH